MDAEAESNELVRLATAGDRSPEFIKRLVDACLIDAQYWVENEHYDGLSARGWSEPLSKRALALVKKIGGPAIEEVYNRIARGDTALLARAGVLGPRIVEAAELLLADGPVSAASAAMSALDVNLSTISSEKVLANYLRAFDRCVHASRIKNDLLVDSWRRFATADGRAAIATRWNDGTLQPWVESRSGGDAWHVRHLLALLAGAPVFDLGMITQLLHDRELEIVFEPIAVIDGERSRAVIEADKRTHAWAVPKAIQIAQYGGGSGAWGGKWNTGPEWRLVTAVNREDVYELVLAFCASRVGGGYYGDDAHWDALITYVGRDRSRFPEAARIAIENQLQASGPGVPSPRAVLKALAAIDPVAWRGLVRERAAAISRSRNAGNFGEWLH